MTKRATLNIASLWTSASHSTAAPALSLRFKKRNSHAHKDICMRMFIALLVLVAEDHRQPKCVSGGDGINKQWDINRILCNIKNHWVHETLIDCYWEKKGRHRTVCRMWKYFCIFSIDLCVLYIYINTYIYVCRVLSLGSCKRNREL